MATETQKRRDTMSVLDKLRAEGKPVSSKYRNEFTGEGMPLEEEAAQDEFQRQKGARVEQSMVNTMPEGALSTAYDATAEVGRGPTGMSPLTAPAGTEGMVPYSPEEFERRSSFSKMEMPGSSASKGRGKRKKKADAEELSEDTPDVPVSVSGGY